jgi:very-short-patch-repair endonuclease
MLKGKKILGYQFSRQKPIGNYIVDFYCPQLKLMIEVDGNSHDSEKYEKDKERENFLIKLGFSVLHINDIDVKKDINRVVSFLEEWIVEREKQIL